ncbi:MAG: hypothetical protein LIP02_13735 [Bacteroidales bacterium]|nr:hypothetical protein [Bacteroidales bacterium]
MEDQYITRPEFEQYSQRMDEYNKRQDGRLKDIDAKVEKIGGMAIQIQRLADNTDMMLKEQKSASERLKAIEDEPKETIKTVRAAVLSAIGGAVAAAIVAAILAFI